jgi:hypothetical protein
MAAVDLSLKFGPDKEKKHKEVIIYLAAALGDMQGKYAVHAFVQLCAFEIMFVYQQRCGRQRRRQCRRR